MKLSYNRAGDNVPMAVIEYVDRPGEIHAARPNLNLPDNYIYGPLNFTKVNNRKCKDKIPRRA